MRRPTGRKAESTNSPSKKKSGKQEGDGKSRTGGLEGVGGWGYQGGINRKRGKRDRGWRSYGSSVTGAGEGGGATPVTPTHAPPQPLSPPTVHEGTARLTRKRGGQRSTSVSFPGGNFRKGDHTRDFYTRAEKVAPYTPINRAAKQGTLSQTGSSPATVARNVSG